MAILRELKKAYHRIIAHLDYSEYIQDLVTKPVSRRGISANIICKNNENCILFCLQSLTQVVNEIVIIDTGSTDTTVALAESFLKANQREGLSYKLIQEPEFQGYSYHRNQAIAASTQDWILVLDSDEFLSPELETIIVSLAQSSFYSGYKFYRRWIQNFTQEAGSWELDYICANNYPGRYKSIIRMFRRLDSVKYRGEIHEAVFGLESKRIQTIAERKASIYHLDVAINSIETRLKKVLKREALLKGSGHPEEYLPELFNLAIQHVKIKPCPQKS